MILAESRRSRRFIGRLDRGLDLFGAFVEICRAHEVRTAWLRGLGSLEAVELAEYDQAARVWKPARKFDGGFEVLQLTGNVSERDGQLFVHAHASLMRDRDSGIELLGGHIVSGRVFALEFVIETFDDLILRRGADKPTGLVQWSDCVRLEGLAPTATPPTPVASAAPPAKVVPVAPPSATTLVPPAPPGGPSWAEVAAASEQVDTTPAQDEDPVRLGDIIDHPKFGKGEVQRIEGADEYVHLRLPSGRLVRLSLDVLKLDVVSRDGKRRVFKARVE